MLGGGEGAAKSHFWAESLIEDILSQHTRAVCAREIQNSIKDSVKQLLEDKIGKFGVEKSFRVTEREITGPHDSLVIFRGLQSHTATSIKSLEGFTRCWVEEAQTISQRSLDLLIPTFRTGSELWFSWNRLKPTDPVDVLFEQNKDDPDFICIGVTYRDNPWFPDELYRDMLRDRKRDIDKYNHVWEGQYQTLSEARVFKNVTVEAFETPDDAEFYFGADFGFAVDPTTIVRMWIKGRKLFIDHEAYKVGCEIDETPALFAGSDPQGRWENRWGHPGIPGATKWPIRADSARPETISYLNQRGLKVVSALKGKGSVAEGIEFMKSYDIVVHPRCKHTQAEFTFYSYKTDKLTGKVIPVLEEGNEHCLDSCRYGLEQVRLARPLQVFF